jgi:hypothetical protein
METSVKFIGLSGKKQVGKDYAATVITSLLLTRGIKVGSTAFAAALKEIVEMLGVPAANIYGSDADKNKPTNVLWDRMPDNIRFKYRDLKEAAPARRSGPMSAREVLQVVGTDIFRAIKDNVWAESPFVKDWSKFDVVLFTDVRFPNEKDAIESRGGIVLRVNRNTGLKDNHVSETALDDANFQYVIDNNGTLEEYNRKVEDFVWRTILR